MNIGPKLKAKRKELELTVTKLAKILNIPEGRIYKWEKGTKPSDTDDMKKVMDFIESGLESIPVTKIKIPDLTQLGLESLIEVMAGIRLLTYILAEIQAEAKGTMVGSELERYQAVIDDNKRKIEYEIRKKSS